MSAFLNGFAAGATPGIEAGVGGMNDQKAANKQGQAIATDMSKQGQALTPELQAANATSDANNPELQAALHPMADPNHPAWGIMSQAAGVPQDQGGVPGMPGMAEGGVVGAAKGPLPANFGGAKGYQNGGEVARDPRVRQNYGIPTAVPPMLPTGQTSQRMAQGQPVGPNSGVAPASTEGQVLTMEDGGFVNTTSMMGVPGQGTPPMSGKWAGISAGLPAGMAMGHNLMEQYHQQKQRQAASDAEGTESQAAEKAYRQANGMAPMEDESSGSLVDRAHSAINNFFSMVGHHSHDEQGNQPHPDFAPPPAQSGALPAPAAPAAAAPPQPTGGAPGTPGAVGSPGSAPSPLGAGAPPAAAPPGGSPPPGGAPPAGAAPPSPGAAAGQQAQAIATAKSGDPQQGAATGQAVAAAKASLAKPTTGSADTQTPGGAYSMDPHDFLRMEHAKTRAAQAAAMAGMDPTKVYSALSAQQTAHFQGQYLQQVGRAQQALMAGNFDDMQKYLKNAGYYLPNGQDTEFKKASELDPKQLPPGTDSNARMITNPFFGMPGHEKDSQYIPLSPMSLQGFATAALDPRAFAQGQQEMLIAGWKNQNEAKKAQASADVGTGRKLMGESAYGNMLSRNAETPAVIADKRAHADMEEAIAGFNRSRQSGTGGGVKVKPSDIRAAQAAGAKAVDDAAQGALTTTPPYMMGPDGKPQIDQSTGQPVPNPHGNQPMHDPTKVSPAFQGMSPQDREHTKMWAGEILSANLQMDPARAAEVAAKIVKGGDGTHINPKTHKAEKDVVQYMDKGNPAMRVWLNGQYVHMWGTPNVDQSSEGGPAINVGSAPGGSSGESGGGEMSHEEQNVANGE